MEVKFLATDKKFKGDYVYELMLDSLIVGEVRRLMAGEKNAEWCMWGYFPKNPERSEHQFGTFEQAYKSLTLFPPRA